MDWIGWLVVIVIALVAIGRRAGAVRRGFSQVQDQVARQIQPPRPTPPPVRAASPPPPPQRQAPASPPPQAAPVPAPLRRSLREAFGDPAHARTAVILAEILGPPRALR